MRTVGWVVVVSIAVVGWAAWLLHEPEGSPPVTEDAPVAAPVAVRAARAPEPVAAALEPAVTDAAVDAGQPLEDVAFMLVRDGARAVGERVTLRRDKQQVSGVLNVLGAMTLPLEPGEWTVSAQGLVSPATVHVPTDGGVVTLTVTSKENLTVCVRDDDNQPLDATFIVRDGTAAHSDSSGATGCRALFVAASEVDVWVEDPDVRSAVTHVQLPARVTLYAARLYSLWVELSPETLENPSLSVSHRLGVSTGRCSKECRVRIPAGEYALVAAGLMHGRVMFARHEGTAASKDSELKLTLGVAPPITGVVRDAAGVPLPNVPLRFVAAPSTGAALTPTLTRDDGTFSVEAQSVGRGPFPTWEILSTPPWQLSPARVALGDAPVQLTAELLPQPPEAQRQ